MRLLRATAGSDHRPFITLNHHRQIQEEDPQPPPPPPGAALGSLLARAAGASRRWPRRVNRRGAISSRRACQMKKATANIGGETRVRYCCLKTAATDETPAQ